MEKQITELREDMLRQQEVHRKAVEKHNAEITTVREALKALETKKLADSSSGAEEIKKINKALNATEDKIKTLEARQTADKRYGDVDGFAEHLSDSLPAEKHIDFRKVAKSVLNDPFKDTYKSAFLKRVADPNDQRGSKANLLKVVADVKDSAVSEDESFIKKNLTTIVGDQAGYFCPPEIDLELQKVLFETSPLRQVATVKTTTRGHYEFRIRTQLPSATWGNDEQDPPAESSNQLYQLGKIAVDKLQAIPVISVDMLEDSIVNIEAELRDALQEAFMLAENKAFIDGNGQDRPTGIVEYAKNGAPNFATDKPLKMVTQDFDKSNYDAAEGSYHLADALLNLNAKLLSPYKRRAVYLMSRQVKNLVRQVKDKNNQYLFSVGQNWGGVQGVPQIRDGRNGMVNGYGILECDDLPSEFTVGEFPIFFGDFSSYVILDRIGLRLLKDEITSKGMVKYWFRKRVGGGFKFLQGVVAMKVVA